MLMATDPYDKADRCRRKQRADPAKESGGQHVNMGYPRGKSVGCEEPEPREDAEQDGAGGEHVGNDVDHQRNPFRM